MDALKNKTNKRTKTRRVPRGPDEPGGKLEAENVLDFGQHVLVHLVRQVSDGQEQILDLRVGRVAAEDDVSRGGSHVLLVDSSVLVINPAHRALHLQDNVDVYFATGADGTESLAGSVSSPRGSRG